MEKYIEYVADCVMEKTSVGFSSLNGSLFEIINAPFYRRDVYKRSSFVQKLVRGSSALKNDFAIYIYKNYGCPIEMSSKVFDVYKEKFIEKHYG